MKVKDPIGSRFFVISGWSMLALALVSFPFTYFGPMQDGSKRFYGLLHVHAALCFAWLLLYVWQVHRVAQRKLSHHREWGIAGAWLTGAVVMTGVPMIPATASAALDRFGQRGNRSSCACAVGMARVASGKGAPGHRNSFSAYGAATFFFATDR
jgi:hypothetical protein